jgi:Leucine-rich repeat (LRR) protein
MNLPLLPDAMRYLGCDYNHLVSLPELPKNLEILFCSHNQLSALPQLPVNLWYISCGSNLINGLDVTNLNLYYLHCSYNYIPDPSDVKGFPIEKWDGRNYVFYPQNISEPFINVSSANCRPGNEVTLAVTLEDNPGIIAMSFSISFNDKSLRFEGFEDTGLLSGPTHSPATEPGAKSPVWFTWEDGLATVDNTVDGDIVKLRFRVLEDTMPVEYSITLSYYPGDIMNNNLSPVHFDIKNGIINVPKFMYGDLNDDGLVNLTDSVILRRYTAKWPLADIGVDSINLDAADVNNDGLVNLTDSVILRRHTAKWPEYAILPYEPPKQPAQLSVALPLFPGSNGLMSAELPLTPIKPK